MPAPKPKLSKVCARCGASFTSWPSRAAQQYCSKACSNAVNGQHGSTHNDKLSARVPQMVAMYAQGKTTHEIAAEVGTSVHSVCYRLRQAGVELRTGGNRRPWSAAMRQKRNDYHETHRPHNFLDVPTDELVSMYAQGMAALRIGHALGVSESTVLDRLVMLGVAVRRQGYSSSRRALDGHLVQSGLEEVVDNWLFEHGLAHEIQPVCPWVVRRLGNSPRADFRVGNVYIEVWGIKGSPAYEARRTAKLDRYRACGAALIELYPADIHAHDFTPLLPLLD